MQLVLGYVLKCFINCISQYAFCQYVSYKINFLIFTMSLMVISCRNFHLVHQVT